jgi:hypothetical protein
MCQARGGQLAGRSPQETSLSNASRASRNSCMAAANRASCKVDGFALPFSVKLVSSAIDAACTSRAASTTRSSASASFERGFPFVILRPGARVVGICITHRPRWCAQVLLGVSVAIRVGLWPWAQRRSPGSRCSSWMSDARRQFTGRAARQSRDCTTGHPYQFDNQ